MPTRHLLPKYLHGKQKPRPNSKWWNEQGQMVRVISRPGGVGGPLKSERGRVWFLILPDKGQEVEWLPLGDFWAQYTLITKVTQPTRHLRRLTVHLSQADSATLKWTGRTRGQTEQALAEEILAKACLDLRNHLLEPHE